GGASLPAALAVPLGPEGGAAAAGALGRWMGRREVLHLFARVRYHRGRGPGEVLPARLAEVVGRRDRGTAGRALVGGHHTTVCGRTALAWSTSAYRALGSGSRLASSR